MFLSTKDISLKLGLKIETIQALCRKRKLTAYRIGREWKFKPEDVEEYIEKHKNTERIK